MIPSNRNPDLVYSTQFPLQTSRLIVIKYIEIFGIISNQAILNPWRPKKNLSPDDKWSGGAI